MNNEDKDLLLQIKNFSFQVKDKKILKNLSLDIKKNKIYGIVGVNGSGKSTLAKCLMGLGNYQDGASGDILFYDNLKQINISKEDVTFRGRLGINLAWQEPARFEGISINKYLEISLPKELQEPKAKKEKKDKKIETEAEKKERKEREKKRKEIIENVMKRVGMNPKKYLKRMVDKTLSGGERKRVELASLLTKNPSLSILDEPDSGIDIDSIGILADTIRSLKSQNSSVMVITHNTHMLGICDEVYIMKKGVLNKAEEA